MFKPRVEHVHHIVPPALGALQLLTDGMKGD